MIFSRRSHSWLYDFFAGGFIDFYATTHTSIPPGLHHCIITWLLSHSHMIMDRCDGGKSHYHITRSSAASKPLQAVLLCYVFMTLFTKNRKFFKKFIKVKGEFHRPKRLKFDLKFFRKSSKTS